MYRKRFGLTGHPLPRDAQGKTFYDGGEAYLGLQRVFRWLADDPGLGLLVGEAGVGKTAAIRNLAAQLPTPENKVVYICDTAVTPASVYRNLAAELGLAPSHRRDDLWRQLKRTITHMVDTEGVIPMLILDEAQHLRDDFFDDLAGFLNYAFDTRDLLTVWLVGLPPLATRLRQRRHAALATRIVSPNEMQPRSRDELQAMIDHALKVRGATQKLLADPARELLWRVSRGIPRQASKLLRHALVIAHEREQGFVDEDIMIRAIEALQLERPTRDRPTEQMIVPTKSSRSRRSV
jgi:MSHA biogenesis protein MshM